MATVKAYATAAGTRYRVRYRKPDGSQTDKRGFRTKRDANLFLATVEVKKASGDYIDPTRAGVTVSAIADSWLGAKKTALKPSAYRVLESAWRIHVEARWGSIRLVAIEHTDVQDWVTGIAASKSATTTIRAYGVLAGVLDAAVSDRRMPKNPARGVELPRKQRKRHVYLTHEQVDRLARAAGERALLVYMLAYTGLRWGEAIGLRVRDLDLKRHRIQVTENAVAVGSEIVVGTPKNHKQRSVPFPAFLRAKLKTASAGKRTDALVFGSNDEYEPRPRHANGWYAKAKTAANVPATLTLHDLRHTAASLAVSAGANVKALQRMLGHESAAMTLDLYADLFDDDLNSVAVALDRARSRALRAHNLPTIDSDGASPTTTGGDPVAA
ncbi:tyrosine-type recombinase/integrase [Humibacter ginsenosidimutans]|uniref:Site-specific integrase n=1 Tax=Humibacter ginsenosidimutans TaxID=2599293 RepID=A0A5B8M5D0_9MICO|nr:site-specific integrase [Humibacter ginsenosidimutans]QDZ15817.1 site-specific integrase [Humibacter ginsenosidimutans]